MGGFHLAMYANARSDDYLSSSIIFSAATDLPIQDVALRAAGIVAPLLFISLVRAGRNIVIIIYFMFTYAHRARADGLNVGEIRRVFNG